MMEFPYKIKRSNTAVKEAACPGAHLYPLSLQPFKVLRFSDSQNQTPALWASHMSLSECESADSTCHSSWTTHVCTFTASSSVTRLQEGC